MGGYEFVPFKRKIRFQYKLREEIDGNVNYVK